MSTRSLVGGLTDSGTYVVYVHSDGYPEGRLPVLEAIIKRDGPAKALVNILSARAGGWSYLEEDTPPTAKDHLDGRGRVVEGYGLQYNDAPEATPLRFPEEYDVQTWIEYVYLIPEVGPIRYAAADRSTPPEEWDWKEHHVEVAAEG
jgi:hypothetical protein